MGQGALRDAAVAGDLEALASELAAGGCSVDSVDDEGFCALHMAAQAGAAEMVRCLLDEYGSAVDQRTEDGRTSLYLSVCRDDLDTVQVLLSREADPNLPADRCGDTPLHIAASLARPDMTKLLLLHGANPRAADSHGDTPLHVAASHGRVEHIQLLLGEGASANAENNVAITPLWKACENGPWIEDEEVQKAECAALYAKSNELMAAKLYAEGEKFLLASEKLKLDPLQQRDSCKVARLLLQHGADVNCADMALGHTPLTVAAEQACVAYQEYLQANPPPEKPVRKRREPEPDVIDEEPKFGHRVQIQLDLMLMLLKCGADHEHVNTAGQNALMLSAQLPAIQALLLGKSKADEGLLAAATTGNMAKAREARDNGASLSKTVSRGTSTVLHMAASFGQVSMNPHGHLRASGAMIKFLLNERADINAARGGDKMTPLCIAAQAGHKHIVHLLLQRGAARDLPNYRGLTPLWYAARNGHVDVAEVLLHGSCTDECEDHCTKRHAGSRIDRANADGISPLWIAAASGHEAIVRKLLVHRAQIDFTDKSGATPLWIACKRGHETVAQLLANGVAYHVDLGSPIKPNEVHPRANADR